MNKYWIKQAKGYTAVELVIAMGIAGLVIAATSLFISRGIGSNRQQFEQVLTTENARKQLKTISDTVRDARNRVQDDWLLRAEPNEIMVAANVDNDAEIETVRYFLDGSELKRGVTQPGGEEKVRTVTRGARNLELQENLFTYASSEGNTLEEGQANSANVERIIVSLRVDNNTDQDPGAAQLLVELTSRADSTETARMWPISLNFPQNPEEWDGADGPVEVTITNPETGEQTMTETTIAAINDGRMETYSGGYYVNLNYQSTTDGSDLPGWYTWAGPIFIGSRDGAVITKIDKFLQNELCLGRNMPELLTGCERRWVAAGVEPELYKTYIPIILFRQTNGQLDYVRDISYGIEKEVSPTPEPSATPTPPADDTTCFIEVTAPKNGTVKPPTYKWDLAVYVNGGNPDSNSNEVYYFDNGKYLGSSSLNSGSGYGLNSNSGGFAQGVSINPAPGNHTVIATLNAPPINSPGGQLVVPTTMPGASSCKSEPITFTVSSPSTPTPTPTGSAACTDFAPFLSITTNPMCINKPQLFLPAVMEDINFTGKIDPGLLQYVGITSVSFVSYSDGCPLQPGGQVSGQRQKNWNYTGSNVYDGQLEYSSSDRTQACADNFTIRFQVTYVNKATGKIGNVTAIKTLDPCFMDAWGQPTPAPTPSSSCPVASTPTPTPTPTSNPTSNPTPAPEIANPPTLTWANLGPGCYNPGETFVTNFTLKLPSQNTYNAGYIGPAVIRAVEGYSSAPGITIYSNDPPEPQEQTSAGGTSPNRLTDITATKIHSLTKQQDLIYTVSFHVNELVDSGAGNTRNGPVTIPFKVNYDVKPGLPGGDGILETTSSISRCCHYQPVQCPSGSAPGSFCQAWVCP
ncbi:MAG: type II secretion system protein [Candidatus Andersenbacteria bacterium]|nr:type II secretion system protein [Candidatus Andersenbacteria bacterium]MBI3250953.1 type II secretion system protein [Candidatus Andersenbacteria bacterium]